MSLCRSSFEKIQPSMSLNRDPSNMLSNECRRYLVPLLQISSSSSSSFSSSAFLFLFLSSLSSPSFLSPLSTNVSGVISFTVKSNVRAGEPFAEEEEEETKSEPSNGSPVFPAESSFPSDSIGSACLAGSFEREGVPIVWKVYAQDSASASKPVGMMIKGA